MDPLQRFKKCEKPTDEQAMPVDIDQQKEVRSRNMMQIALLAPSFYAIEWGLVGVATVIVTFLKYHGLSEMTIWLILWGLNLLFSSAVVVFNDRFRIDITLMVALRKFTNATSRKSKLAGYFLELAVFIRLLLWDGPSQLLIYFRERVPSSTLRGCFFVGSGGFQMFIWVKLYILGYESLGDLLRVIK